MYRTLLAVVEHQTLSAAARVLHTTQPTVTRQLQQLERQLGAPLFDRAGKRMTLTGAGERVYAFACELQALEVRLREELREFADPSAGLIRIGAGLSPTLYRLPSILAQYAGQHPRVRFQVITGSSKLTMERLQARTVDAAIVTTPPAASDDLWMTPLWCDALVVVAPAGHPLIGRACMLTDLAQQPMVVMHPDSGLRQLVHDTFARMGVADPVLPLMETDSLEAMSRFVQAGMGLAIVPWPAVADDVHAGRLCTVELTDVDLGARTVTLVVRQQTTMPQAVQAFVTWLAAQSEAPHCDLR
ncbi:DNA-binding transcriptional LysR family regulator [Alicyclobacillus sacchari]|uniref:DNA-binding transcriptional LysR family regulator n=1 Tax=Alicyclobacillus sacchari TaxID=392010 RepID=A0A4R8LU04_9BACL|nr:DNA-binding transcriptional LysR family regulator [Alicyclobacillus sacchari]